MITAIGSAIRPGISSAISIANDGVTSLLDAQFAAFMGSLSGPRVLLDPSRASSRFQDGAASTLVTVDGQPFARLNDASGAGNHVRQTVSGSMPAYRTDGALHWAAFDGIDDSWKSLANIDFSGTDKATVIAGVRKRSDAAAGMLVELSASFVSNPGSFALLAPHAANQPTYYFGLSSTAVDLVLPVGYPAPNKSVLSVAYDIAGASITDEIKPRVNGVGSATGAAGSAGTGNFGNYPLYIGRRNDAALPAAIDLFGLIVIGRLLTADELSLCERWMASKTGVTL